MGFLFLVPGAFLAATEPKIAPTEVGPGPTALTDTEKAIVADPAKGMQHGVVLLIEEDLDEGIQDYSQHAFHFRAKILSNDARALANVEIPWVAERNVEIVKWWGRTLHPDGRVSELPREELKQQTIERSQGREVKVLKGALPAVEPGCVIDYGWVLQNRNLVRLKRFATVSLQRAWLVRELRLRWTPYEYLANGFLVSRAGGLNVTARRVTSHIVVTAGDLPPVPDEPWMPTVDLVRASAYLFYFPKAEDHKDFWNASAKRIEKDVTAFNADAASLKAALAGMGIAEGAGLGEKLRTAHDWMAANLKNRSLLSREEEEAEADEGGSGDRKSRRKPTARDILAAREGTARQLDLLFVGLARALGAEAWLVLAPDRTDHSFISSIYTLDQFDSWVVAVHLPGEPPEKLTYSDPGSGLGYGEIPWWLSGGQALRAGADGSKFVNLPHGNPERSLVETSAEIALAEPGEPAAVAFASKSSGQAGLLDWRRLRWDGPDERRERLEAMCGHGSEVEVESADAAGLENVHAERRLDCKGLATSLTLADGSPSAKVAFAGPWIESLPAIDAGPRLTPMIFSFPRSERQILTIAAPPGWTAVEPPQPVAIDSPFGMYNLSVEATSGGYRVERSLTLPKATLAPNLSAGFHRFLSQIQIADRTSLEFRRSASGGS